jgi:hypothetical protein
MAAIDPAFAQPDADRSAAARAERWRDLIDGLAGSARPRVRFIGFKLMLNQAEGVLDGVLTDPALRIVLLERGNLLAMYASSLAHRAKIEGTPAARFPAGEFDAADFDAFAARTGSAFQLFRQRAAEAGKQIINARYVDLLGASEREAGRIAIQIGTTPDRALRIRTQKIGSPDILARFTNPAAARAHLAQIGHEDWAFETPAPSAAMPDRS